jgi:hypothetical protein
VSASARAVSVEPKIHAMRKSFVQAHLVFDDLMAS